MPITFLSDVSVDLRATVFAASAAAPFASLSFLLSHSVSSFRVNYIFHPHQVISHSKVKQTIPFNESNDDIFFSINVSLVYIFLLTRYRMLRKVFSILFSLPLRLYIDNVFSLFAFTRADCLMDAWRVQSKSCVCLWSVSRTQLHFRLMNSILFSFVKCSQSVAFQTCKILACNCLCVCVCSSVCMWVVVT